MALISDKEDNKSKRRGLIVTIGVHGILLLVFFFLLAWQEPNPPYPEYGIELSLGVDDQGFGQQPDPSNSPIESEVDESQESEEIIEELIEEVTEVAVQEQAVETVQDEGPDVTEEIVEDPEPVVEEEEKVEEKKPVINQNAMMGDQTKNTNSGNKGDDPDTQGNKGDERGLADANTFKGTPGGGGGGPEFNVPNWKWNRDNIVKDDSHERGEIVFKITINSSGGIEGIVVDKSNVNPTVVNHYKDQVERFTFDFVPSSPGETPASKSSGTITFHIEPK